MAAARRPAPRRSRCAAATTRSSRCASTDHGPLLSDVSPTSSPRRADDAAGPAAPRTTAVSLAWTALQPSNTADAILELNLATGWDEFRAAAADFAVPAQNMVYADREGHIGYQAPGLVPIRQSGNDGSVPTEGWRPENDWTGEFVPFDGLPHALDPEEGFVVAANQAVVGEDYPFYLTADWDQGYRSERIRDRIEADRRLSVAEMAALQTDDRNPMAADAGALPPRRRPAARLLPRRPGPAARLGRRQPADSAAAAYFNAVWSALLALTFHDELRGGVAERATVVRRGDGAARRSAASWWDDATDDVVETRDDMLRRPWRTLATS